MRVEDIAALLGCGYEGDGSKQINGAAPVETAGREDLSFVAGRKAVQPGQVSQAGCLIVLPDYQPSSGQTIIRHPQPRSAFAAVLAKLYPAPEGTPGVHPSAVLSPECNVHPSCSIGPFVTIEAGAVIEERTVIHAGAFIGARTRVGPGSLLHPRVTIYHDVSVGARAVLHSGCVLGADGFGFVLDQGRYYKFPQVGRVELGDDVEIGANSCVDRAALGVTSIGDGAKLDNMVHIGHNCRIGRHVVIAAQTGLSGGVTVEDYAVIGGQVGIGDKARIESKAVLGSGSGVLTSKIVRSGETVWGTPARPLKQYLQQLAILSKLPELRADINELKKQLK